MAALLHAIGVSVCIIRYSISNRRSRDRFSLSRFACRVEYSGIGSKHLLTWATGREMRGGAVYNRDGKYKQTKAAGGVAQRGRKNAF